MQLWQNAVNTIDHLEEELRIYQEGSKNFIAKKDVEKFKSEQEQKIKNLQKELMEAKTQMLKYRGKDYFKQTELAPTKVVGDLQQEIESLQKQLLLTNNIKTDLIKTVKKQNKKIQELKSINQVSQNKVSEAIQVVEAAFVEKDCAIMKEKEAKNETKRISKDMAEVIRDTERKIKQEVEMVKSDLGCNLKTILEDLKAARSESQAKQNEIELYANECQRLQNVIDMLKKKNCTSDEIGDSRCTKLLKLEKNYEQTFQNLLTSERENIILKSEIERTKTDMMEMTRHYESDIKTREIEKTSLTTKIKQLEFQISESDKKYVGVLEQLEDMKARLFQMQESFKEDIGRRECESRSNHALELEKIREKYESTIKQLQDQLESQVKLNHKWRDETKIIVNKLGSQVRHQKEMISKLGHTNFNLQQRLKLKKERSGKVKCYQKGHSKYNLRTLYNGKSECD